MPFAKPIGPIDQGRLAVSNTVEVKPINCKTINAVFVRQQNGTAWLDFEPLACACAQERGEARRRCQRLCLGLLSGEVNRYLAFAIIGESSRR